MCFGLGALQIDNHHSLHRPESHACRAATNYGSQIQLQGDVSASDVVILIHAVHALISCRPRMYKTKFERWGLRKNLNVKLKDELQRARPTNSYAMSSSCKLRLSRISAQAAGLEQALTPLISRTWSGSSDDQNVEAVLSNLKIYHQSSSTNGMTKLDDTRAYTSDDLITACKAPNFNTSLFMMESRPQDVWSLYNSGLVLLQKRDFIAARVIFDQACEDMREVLRAKPQDFFRKIFMVLGARQWSRFDDFRRQLLNFVAGMACKALGQSHPLAIILSHLQYRKCLDCSAEPCLRYLSDIASHQEALLLVDSFAVVLIRQQNYERAERVLNVAIANSESVQGYSHEDTRIYLRRLANMYMHQERWAETDTVCRDILQRDEFTAGVCIHDDNMHYDQTQTTTSVPVLKECSIRTMQDLAFLAAQRGDLTLSENWSHRAAQALLRLFTLDQLQDMLSKRGHSGLPDQDDPLACARKVLDCCSSVWCCGDKNG